LIGSHGYAGHPEPSAIAVLRLPAPPPTKPPTRRKLKVGANGADVVALQTRLTELR
jgi:hypothetical protein